MELAATAFAALGSAATAAAEVAPTVIASAAEAGGWATTMTPAVSTVASAGSGILSALQTTATVGSAVTSLLGGIAGRDQAQAQSVFAGLNARSEELASQAKAIEIQRRLVEQVGATRVSMAASGLDVSSGHDIEASLGMQADEQTRMAIANGRAGAASSLAQVASLSSRGDAAYATGLAGAARAALGQALDISKRG